MKAGIIIGHLNNKGNEGALIRTAEAFGINNIFVIGKKQKEYYTSEGCDRHVNFFIFEKEKDLLNHILKENLHLVCIENINDAKEISEVEKYPANPVFITGNEKLGVSKEFLECASLIVKIQQGNGYANCLNTGTAGGIIMHDFIKKHNLKRDFLWEESGSRSSHKIQNAKHLNNS